MDVVVVGLVNVAVFMVIFVPVSQRLLGVRFGFGRLAVGAGLTLAVFSPLLNALAGPLPWTGSTGAAVAFLALTALCSMLARAHLSRVVRGAGAHRVVAQGPGSAAGSERARWPGRAGICRFCGSPSSARARAVSSG